MVDRPIVAAGWVALALAIASPLVPHAQPPYVPAKGTFAPMPIDPGRPWGWMVRAMLEHPNQPLYNLAKRKLLEGKQIFGHSISKFDIETYCRLAPHYDFTWFDTQHAPLTFSEIYQMLQACPRAGAAPLVRLADAEEANIQHAMDAGLLGIVVPGVDDAARARQAAILARFPPQARRGSGNLLALGKMWDPLAAPGSNYRSSVNDNMLVIAMIETVEAVNNALEIAVTPGVDVVIVGNQDLQSFSGFHISEDRYQDLLTKTRDATYLAGKFWGTGGNAFPKASRLYEDARFNEHGPTNDGWVDTGHP